MVGASQTAPLSRPSRTQRRLGVRIEESWPMYRPYRWLRIDGCWTNIPLVDYVHFLANTVLRFWPSKRFRNIIGTLKYDPVFSLQARTCRNPAVGGDIEQSTAIHHFAARLRHGRNSKLHA